MIIAVASGKGGTGKTTIATNLALSIGFCQLMDFDVEAPNASFFLDIKIKHIKKVTIKQPYFLTGTGKSFEKCAEFCRYNAVASVNDEVIFFPDLCHGCGGCILVGPEGAVREKDVEVGQIKKGTVEPGISFVMGDLNPGSMRTTTIISELEKIKESDQTVIVDCPPGNSCPMVSSVRGSDYCILVAESTPYGLSDMIISVQIMRRLNLPFGVIINKSDVNDALVEDFCSKENIKILAKIPNDINIAKAYSKGMPLVEYDKSWIKEFKKIFEEIKKEKDKYEADSNN